MSVLGLLKHIFLLDILKGMALTLRMMFTRAITRQYPEEKHQAMPGYRGRHALVRDPVTGSGKCVGCLQCAIVCPSRCIHIEHRELRDGSRVIEGFTIEASRCVYCGYCVEVCPVCAIMLTEHYEYSSGTRADLTFDKDKLLKNWDEFFSRSEAASYFNKFWRPEGLDQKRMAPGKRTQMPVRAKAKQR